MSKFTVIKGSCTVMFAYDVGFGISLDRAERLLATSKTGRTQREYLRYDRKSPRSFEYRPAPLRLTRKGETISIGDHRTEPEVNFTVYDFGAVSVSYTIPIQGPLDGLARLSETLYENQSLVADSRARVAALLNDMRDAVVKPGMLPMVEDYIVYRAESFDCGDTFASDFVSHARSELAAVLRAERGPLSEQEISDATSSLVSYSTADAAIIDWNAAILFGPDMDDVIGVLDFANVELLEMRFLDDQLDRALECAYSATARRARAYWSTGASLREVAGLQMDSSLLFETVNNTLKLLGDQYLARVYRKAADRFHLPDWDTSVLRKLNTLEGLYEKLHYRQTARRMEVLEWIVIILIATEIVAAWVVPLLRAWLAKNGA